MSRFQSHGSGDVRLGQFTSVDSSAEIVFAKPGRVTIGDYCHIGPGVKIVCSGGDLVVGDWTTLHDRCLVLVGEGVAIGEHCWFGQNCVIDGTGGLTIGTGVRVGMYSQLWSHVAAGEQIEGCTLFGTRPVSIGDDVWLVGSCIVASGVTLGRRLVALIGSNITKSWPGSIVIAGSPAAHKTSLSFYREVSLNDKWSMLTQWLSGAADELRLNSTEPELGVVELARADTLERVVFVREAARAAELRGRDSSSTVCCIEDKSYNKRLNETEQRVLKFLAGNKARFRALSQAHVASS